MQRLYTLSAYETTAAAFFSRLAAEKTDLVLDVRLRNTSQLCGFTKEKDLAFFVPQLTGARYVHDLLFAPEPGLLDLYTKQHIGWEVYGEEYRRLLEQRKAVEQYGQRYAKFSSVCLLGTQTLKRRSHTQVLYALLSVRH